MISLIQMEYIIAVDKYRHFVTAAEKSFVTQPTLSMQIKKLEDDLGVIIFDRSKQPIIPTELGEKIIEQARRTVNESKKIKDIVDEHQGTIRGSLNIGIIPSLAPYLLPLFIGDFIRKYPDVLVNVIEQLSEDILSNLKSDKIDVGILVTPVAEKGIAEEPLFYEEMLIYANKNHEIASKEELAPAELSSPDMWLLSNGHCFRSQVVNLCNYKEKVSNNNHFHYESGSLETIKKMVEKEGGFSLIPELAINREDTNEEIILRKFKSSTPLREVSFVYSRNYAKRRLLDLLKQEIIKSVPEKMLKVDRGEVIKWRNRKA